MMKRIALLFFALAQIQLLAADIDIYQSTGVRMKRTVSGAVALDTAGAFTIATGATLTQPKFADLGFIADSSGNEILIFDTTSSAVNEFTLSNAATAGTPKLAVTGGDTNISMALEAKGTGTITLNSAASFSSFANASTTRINLGISSKYKTGDTSRTSTTTPTADPDLTMNVVSGETWSYRIIAYVASASNTPDVKFGVSGTSTVSHLRNSVRVWSNTLLTAAAGADTSFNTGYSADISTGANYIIDIEGTATFNGTGTFAFFWSQNVSDGTATVIQQNSTLNAIRRN